MKDARIRSADDCLAKLDAYDLVIDARSPSEYELDHIPGAINLPVLDDAQRAQVGLLNAQQGAFIAKRLGAALVSRNIADILSGPLLDKPARWRPLVYCWRGGNRSGSLATVLARIGWPAEVLDGGYRAFRRKVVADLACWPNNFEFRVIAGRTGSGKSRLLTRLAKAGAQVLDLEQLANHRGSVLGPVPTRAQPSQKHFETRIWQLLAGFNQSKPVYVESESRKIGQCQIPEALIGKMRDSICIVLDADLDFRTRLLIADYPHFIAAPSALNERLGALIQLHGHQCIDRWRKLACAQRWQDLVGELLVQHYDPAYDRSMQRNFRRLSSARHIMLAGDDIEQALAEAAATIMPPCD